MNESSSAIASERACPHCGAELKSPWTECWLCGAPIRDDDVRPEAAAISPSRPRSTPRERVSFSLSTLMLVMTLATLACGLIVVAPGLGIVACILIAPVTVRTAMVVNRREAAGGRVSPGEKAMLFFSSFLVTSVIVAVVGVASVGTFCGVCIGGYALLGDTQAFRGESWPLIIAIFGIPILTALAVTIPIIRLLARWVRARYRRDTDQDLL